jgi:hypothetical protein
VLTILITFQWLMGEAARQGVSVSVSEARAMLTRFAHENHLSNTAFQKYLGYTSQSLADVLLVLKMDALVTKLQQTITAKRGAAGAAKSSTSFRSGGFGRPAVRLGM